jgi:hypothetical protein
MESHALSIHARNATANDKVDAPLTDLLLTGTRAPE